jgi:hypothetical protein
MVPHCSSRKYANLQNVAGKKQDGEQLLKQSMVELLTLRAGCSLVASKPAHSSDLTHFW